MPVTMRPADEGSTAAERLLDRDRELEGIAVALEAATRASMAPAA